MKNFDSPESFSNEGENNDQEKQPISMDDLLDQLNGLDKDDPDFETKKAELLGKMQEAKHEIDKGFGEGVVGVEEVIDSAVEADEENKTREQLAAARKRIEELSGDPRDPVEGVIRGALGRREKELLKKLGELPPEDNRPKDNLQKGGTGESDPWRDLRGKNPPKEDDPWRDLR